MPSPRERNVGQIRASRFKAGSSVFCCLLAAFFAGSSAITNALAADQATLTLVQTIDLKGKPGKLDHLIVDSKTKRLFLANKVNNTVDVVDLDSGKLVKQLKGQAGAQGLAYAPDLARLYVGLGTGGYCNVFDGKSFQLLKTVKFADDADNVRYEPRTHSVYVAHAEKALGVIDGESLELKTDITLPGSAEAFQLEANRPRLYLNIPSPSQVVVIDTGKNEVVSSYPLKLAGANFALALDEANKRLFIGCRKKSAVVVMDTETGKEITSIDIPADTDDVSFDAKRKRIYASCGEGFIAVIKQNDADNYELVEKFPTVKDARTSYLDRETGRIYLGVPRQEGKAGPEIRVYEPKP
jgi:DNA-binding beta-propeller fold protein YncE